MLYSHYSDIPDDVWRWANFSPDEPNLACPCCGEFFLNPVAMDCLQRTRTLLGEPLTINSGHRCGVHNALVGGAPLSEHKKLALDISLRGLDRFTVYDAAKKAGFTTFGFYQTFLHADTRPGRRWYGAGAKRLWNG